ncbi:MAG TPA: ATP-binding protein [Candidatus Binatia bacterium]|nr:ATP-binding protein [Candidatus Binatia bacterium]
MRPGLTARLMLAYAATVAVLLLSTWWGLRSLADAQRSARQLSDLGVETVRLTSILQTLVQDKGYIADFLITGDQSVLADVRPHRRDFQAWLEQMEVYASTPAERTRLDSIRRTYASYTAKADEVLSLQQRGLDAEAHKVFVSIAKDVETLLGESRDLIALVESDLRERREHVEDVLADGERTIAWMTVGGALFSLLVGFMLSRYAARPIYRLAVRLGTSGAVDELAVAGDDVGVIEARVSALIERVVQQERALQQAEKLSEIGEIATEIAHETLNPLAGVKGMLQALRRAPVSRESLARELTDMEHGLDRVEGIVRRLMDYARPLEPHAARVSVADVLREAARSARSAPSAAEHDIRIAPVAEQLRWDMDPDLMRQVLVNLIANGCEASPRGAPVEVGAAVENGGLVIAVEDHGAGIARAHRERLFRPFFTTKPGGNGLGLAISRKIVQEHGGRIEAVPADHGGTVFRVKLPRDRASACASPS